MLFCFVLATVPSAVDASSVILTSGQTNITITWQEPDPRNGPITDYTIQYRNAGPAGETTDGEWISSSTNSGDITTLSIVDLMPSSYYDLRVAAWTEKGQGAFSTVNQTNTGIASKYTLQ